MYSIRANKNTHVTKMGRCHKVILKKKKPKTKTPLFIGCRKQKNIVKGYEVVSTFKMAAHSPNCGQSYE
jgi:hypothetical protein